MDSVQTPVATIRIRAIHDTEPHSRSSPPGAQHFAHRLAPFAFSTHTSEPPHHTTRGTNGSPSAKPFLPLPDPTHTWHDHVQPVSSWQSGRPAHRTSQWQFERPVVFCNHLLHSTTHAALLISSQNASCIRAETTSSATGLADFFPTIQRLCRAIHTTSGVMCCRMAWREVMRRGVAFCRLWKLPDRQSVQLDRIHIPLESSRITSSATTILGLPHSRTIPPRNNSTLSVLFTIAKWPRQRARRAI